ncbi:MAG: hypothetical protein ABWY57_09240 [Mycetocola sp.]
MKRRGKIKFFDPEQGYGYILPEGEADPTQTIPFEAKDVATEIEELVPGTEVVFEIEEGSTQARKVELA